MTVVDDLRALGVDSAEIRWDAVRDYLAEIHGLRAKSLNALTLILWFLYLADKNMLIRRGLPLNLLDDPKALGRTMQPEIIDLLAARSEAVARYEGKVRERAMTILCDFMPI
jgi:hypothetical protein